MKLNIIIIALLFISITGFSQDAEYSKLDSFFMVLEQNDRFHGSVAVSRGGELIFSKAIGSADMESNIPNNTNTKFRIGSVTKTFTAALIMKAVEMGEINLDQTIDQHFPSIKNAHKITVRHLLNHRSGINNFTDRSFFAWYTQPMEQINLLDTIAHKGVGFQPDAKYSYSNSNYVLLTFLLENVFDQSYPEILEQYIAKPLALHNTSYGGKIDPNQNQARSYRMKDDWAIEPEGHMSIPLGAGGIISTPTDLCRFADALFTGKLISAQSLKQMKPVGNHTYGFALEGVPIDDKMGWGHPGVIDAFNATLAYFEEDDLSFAITCNGSNYGSQDVAVAVLRELYGEPYNIPSFEIIQLPSEVLDQYLGTYISDKLPMDMIISKRDGQLQLEMEGQAPSTLTAEGNHIFSIMKFGVKITFEPSGGKMQFEQQGMAFDFKLKE